MSIGTSHVDNGRLEVTDQEKVLQNTVLLQLGAENQSERGEMRGFAGFEYVNYSGDDLEDKSLYYVQFDAERRFELSDFSVQGGFTEDHLLRTAYIADSPNVLPSEIADFASTNQGLVDGTDVDLGVVTQQIKRTRSEIAPELTYKHSQRTDISLKMDYYSVEFDDSGTGVSLIDNESTSYAMRVTHATTPISSYFMEVDSTHYKPERGPETDSLELTFGWRRSLSELTQFSVQVGARKTDYEDRSKESGVLARVSLSRRVAEGILRGSLGRSLMPNAWGDVVEADTLNLSYRKNLSPRISVFVRGDIYMMDTDDRFSIGRSQDYYNLTAGLNWSLTRELYLGLSYNYRFIDREFDSDHTDANTISLAFSYRPLKSL